MYVGSMNYLSWGTGLVSLQDCNISPVIEY